MDTKYQEMIRVKKTKNLKMYYDFQNQEALIEKDNVFFTLKKNEIFPVLRGLVSLIQRFWRRKMKVDKVSKIVKND